jgi:hypothetical protein
MFEWRAVVSDSNCTRAGLTRIVARVPAAPGAMILPAPSAVAVGPHIAYHHALEFVGDDRLAGRILTPAAPFNNQTQPTNL